VGVAPALRLPSDFPRVVTSFSHLPLTACTAYPHALPPHMHCALRTTHLTPPPHLHHTIYPPPPTPTLHTPHCPTYHLLPGRRPNSTLRGTHACLLFRRGIFSGLGRWASSLRADPLSPLARTLHAAAGHARSKISTISEAATCDSGAIRQMKVAKKRR